MQFACKKNKNSNSTQSKSNILSKKKRKLFDLLVTYNRLYLKINSKTLAQVK